MREGPWNDWPIRSDLSLTAEEFAARIEQVVRSFSTAVKGCPEEELLRPGTHGDWSGKDLIAHCAFWAEYCAEAIRRSIHRTFDAKDFEYADEEAFDQQGVDKEKATNAETLLLRFRQAAFEVADLVKALPRFEWESTDRYKLLIAGAILEEVPEHELQLREFSSIFQD